MVSEKRHHLEQAKRHAGDLTLLTLGPQLRGSNNTLIGKQANQEVFEIIRLIVEKSVTKQTGAKLELENASGRKVVIAFSAP